MDNIAAYDESMSKQDNRLERISRMIALGDDPVDGQVRISTGKDFTVWMGSEATHEEMRAFCMRVNDLLKKRGLELNQLTRRQFMELVEECSEKES